MAESNPHFKKLSDELNQAWQSAAATELIAEISELSQTNRLQTGLLNRLAAQSGSVNLTLITGEVVAGVVMLVGTDGLLVQAHSTKSLIPITSVVAVAKLGKARGLNRPKRQLMMPLLLRQIDRTISVFSITSPPITGKLVAVWADCIDLQLADQQLTLALTKLVKLELS